MKLFFLNSYNNVEIIGGYMNFYNPYLYSVPTFVNTPRVGLFTRLFGSSGITLSGILNGTQRALNFANQAIP